MKNCVTKKLNEYFIWRVKDQALTVERLQYFQKVSVLIQMLTLIVAMLIKNLLKNK